MNSKKTNIFIIHPEDRTTNFLSRISNYIEKCFPDQVYKFRVKPNQSSHDDCLKRVADLRNNLIIFLGHGRSDTLYGACSDEGGSQFVSEEARLENNLFYENTDFINVKNANIFSNNTVFSLSCNSNRYRGSIGREVIKKGAFSFIGFGDIQTDYESEKDFTRREIAIFKGSIVRIIKKSIVYSYSENYTCEKMIDLIKINTNKEIYQVLRDYKSKSYKTRVVYHLYNFKNDIKVFGNTQDFINK